eukprot:scaffold215303_cov19-Tisochrysis_lutea.AAC.1
MSVCTSSYTLTRQMQPAWNLLCFRSLCLIAYSSWSSIAPFIAALYGVNSSKESAEHIVAAARSQGNNLVIIGHIAPLGEFVSLCRAYDLANPEPF